MIKQMITLSNVKQMCKQNLNLCVCKKIIRIIQNAFTWVWVEKCYFLPAAAICNLRHISKDISNFASIFLFWWKRWNNSQFGIISYNYTSSPHSFMRRFRNSHNIKQNITDCSFQSKNYQPRLFFLISYWTNVMKLYFQM